MLNKHNFPTEYSICSKTDVFNFLSHINDTSGFFSKEKNFKTYFPQLYEDFKKIEFPDFTYKWKFSQKLYHFLQDDMRLFYLLYQAQAPSLFQSQENRLQNRSDNLLL